MATKVIDAEVERHWLDGNRAAWRQLLHLAMSELGYEVSEVATAKLADEREQAVATLRSFCAAWGDNDWTPELCLADVIDKHLRRHIEDMAAG